MKLRLIATALAANLVAIPAAIALELESPIDESTLTITNRM